MMTKMWRGLVPMAGLLVALWSATALGAEARPKALVLAWEDGGAAATALQGAGFDAVVPAKKAARSADLRGVRLVVVSADMVLPDELAARIAALVRGGGSLLVVHTSTDPNFWWDAYRRIDQKQPNPSPLWDVLPFTMVPITDQEKAGIRNPFGPTRVLRQAESPLLAGVDLKQAPAFPSHGFMVLPTHPIVQGSHVMLGWSEDQYKSPLWGNGQVLAWGDDPEQRPLLLTAEYGAGRCAAAAAPLFDKAFLQWPGSQVLLKNLTQWLTAQPTQPAAVAENKVYGLGLPWLVRDSLKRMGLTVTAVSENASGAIVYSQPTAEQAKALAAMAKAGKPVVVANPAALRVAPLNALVSLTPAAAPKSTGPAAAPPRPIVDPKLLEGKKMMWSDELWAIDADNVGEAQRWFAPEGAARAKWVAELPASHAPVAAKSPAASEAPTGELAWSKSYRWRLEGSLLDRRDFVEGWDRPEYNDSGWAQQGFSQLPPTPKVLGQQLQGQNVLAGGLWTRAKFTLVNPQSSHQWLVPSGESEVVTLLDGKPLRQKIPLRTLAAGEHLVALRTWPLQKISGHANTEPWCQGPAKLQWPTLSTEAVAGAAAKPKATLWYKGTVHLPADSGWNAVYMGQPSAGVLYVNGERVAIGAGGLVRVPWRPNDNLVVWGSLKNQEIPSMQLAQVPAQLAGSGVPAAQRLSGIWYRRDDAAHEALAQGWPAALAGVAAPAGWTAVTPDTAQGTIAGVANEKAHWFAAPFMVSEAEAQGPARLVINTTGGAVPTDLIKTLWVNGQPVQARIEWVSTQRYGLEDAEEMSAGEQEKLVKPKGGKHKKGDAATNAGEDVRAPGKGDVAAGDEPAANDEPVAKDEADGARPSAEDESAAAEGRQPKGKQKNVAKQTTICFVLSGKLKAGVNWVAFPVDFQNLYGMRMAVPAGMGWTLPLPKLDFSGKVDAVTWAAPLGRLGGAGLVRRGQLMMPPAEAAVLARFSDGAPAVARVGSVIFATSDQSQDWSQWIQETVRIDWAATNNTTRGAKEILSPANNKAMNQGSGDPVQADGTQIAASLLRGAPVILGAEPANDGGAVVTLAAANEPRLLNYQLRNWMGMVLAEGRLAVPANAERVPVPAPASDPSPITTHLRADRWLRVALLDNGGACVRDYLETRVDVAPAVEVLLSPTDGLQRDLPATIPGAPNYNPSNLTWSLIAESPASPIVVPGERIRLRVMCRNTTAQPQQVSLNLAWEGALESKPVALPALQFTLAPYEQRTEVLPCGFQVADMRFMALSGKDAAPLRAMPAGAQPTGDLVTGRVVARAGEAMLSELPLMAVRPWKQFAPYTEKPPGQWGAPSEMILRQFEKTVSLDSLSSEPTRGHWELTLDWWRDHMVDTTGDGGGFGGFNGESNFPWGSFDAPYIEHSRTLDNTGYLPDGVQYQEYLYASISREYNRFLKGTSPLYMQVADYWENGHTAVRERNLVQFLRWREAQGRPLYIKTVGELKERIKNDFALGEDWRIFAREAYLAWGQQFMAGLPPKSLNGSQGGSENYRFGRLHDDVQAFRSVLETHNAGFLQPANLRRRGDLGFSAFRAVDPGCVVSDNYWHSTAGNSQTIGGAWGNSGSVYETPEFTRLVYLDYGLMAIRDEQGRCQPTVNCLPVAAKVHGIPLFTTDIGHSLQAEALTRDASSRLIHLIQPERVLGSYVVPSLERAAKDKVEGSAVKRGSYVTDMQPEVGLTHMLRNYGALWGGMISPDWVNRLQPGEGAIYIMPSGAGNAEAKPMVDFVHNGGHLSIFFTTGGTKTQETVLSDLFGVKYAPLAEGVRGGAILPEGTERPVPQSENNRPQYVAARPGNDQMQGTGGFSNRVLLREVESGKGRATFSALNCDLNWGWDHDVARQIAKAVNWAAGNPVTLPEGVGGSAFEAKGMIFLTLEDLKYTGGPAAIRLKLPAGNYRAAEVFTGQPVKLEASEDGVILHPTLPPNGGSLVVVRKVEQ